MRSVTDLQEALDPTDFRDRVDRWPDGVLIHRGGLVGYANPALVRYLGYDRVEQLRGRRLTDLLEARSAAALSADASDVPVERAPPPIHPSRLRLQNGTQVERGTSTWRRLIEGEATLVTVVHGLPHAGPERAPQRTRTDFRKVIEHLPGSLAVHCGGYMVYANACCAGLLGYDGPEELVGQVMLEIVHPDDRPAVMRRARSTIESDTPSPPMEERLRRRDGTYGWFEVTGVPTEFEGKAAVLIMLHEVTARRESLNFLRALIDASPLAIYTLDMKQRVTDWNPAAERMFGWTKAEVLGLGRSPTILPEELPRIVAVRQRLLAGDRVIDAESRRLRKDGTVIDVHISVSLMRDQDGEPSGFVLLVADVTDRKRAEAALQEKTETLRALFEASPLAIMSLDTAGLARAWNPAAERIFGWQGDEMVGQAVLGDTALGGSLDLLLREGHVAEIEIVKTRKDGRDVTLAASMAPLRDGAGTITGVMATAADITERVQQRAKAEALQQELHRSEAMGRLGTLVAGVAHEVRNPLFCMTATMDSMESRLGEREDLKPFFDVLRGEAARLNHLMSDLLDYGKPPAATFEVSSMGPVIDAAIRACSRGATRAGVTIEALADTTPAPVRMTPSRLVQVFQNLIDNAVQHSPKGSAVRVVGRLNVDGADMSVEYAIIDAGPGFRDIDLPHVMEPFFTRRRGGTGLGLSIVQRIVEQHGGTVVPANHPGGGGSVTVRLPVKREG